MEDRRGTLLRRAIRAAAAWAIALALSLAMTWPLVTGFGSLGRTRSDDSDGLYAIWNVTWVARTLVERPRQLFEANIFYPHRHALAFSELNLVGGIVGIPGWVLTRNPYVTHNSALIFAFTTSALAAWLLARRLSGSEPAAIVTAVVYAFAPYFFAHTPHIQLLMGGGIPLALLLLHRLADAPSPQRGAALGAALAAQALACAYYGILAGLMIGYAALFLSVSRGAWRNRRYWTALAAGAAVSAACVLPFFIPFLAIQESGFHRTLAESQRYSATWADYLVSSAHAHAGLRELSTAFGRWHEPLFPGAIALVFGLAGLVLAAASPRPRQGAVNDRETVLLYGSLGLLVLWSSFGPDAGLYRVLFHAVPLFAFLRAPSRFGVVIPLVLGVLASLAIARLAVRRRAVVAVLVAGLALIELNLLPFPWHRAPAVPRAYALLARLPPGPTAEFPFYGGRVAYPLHTQYMLFSTYHWQPLLNGYSDHIPGEFRQDAARLDSFPSSDSFAVLRQRRVRYVTVHWRMFGPREQEIRERLRPYARHLRELASDDAMTLFEIVTFP